MASKDVESGKGPSSIPHFRLVRDQALVTSEVENWHYDGAGTEEDPYVWEYVIIDSESRSDFQSR